MSDAETPAPIASAADSPTTSITATPYIIVKGAVAALDFYRRAFDARETDRMLQPDGRVGHAEIALGKAVVMLADEYPEMGIQSPSSLGGTTVSIVLDVPDVDRFVATAVAAGATLTRPVVDQFYGYRTGTLEDPFGHRWHVQTRISDLSLDEIQRRAATGQARA
jgi:PhnB protein